MNRLTRTNPREASTEEGFFTCVTCSTVKNGTWATQGGGMMVGGWEWGLNYGAFFMIIIAMLDIFWYRLYYETNVKICKGNKYFLN